MLFIFRNDTLPLFPFVLQPSISVMTSWWSEIPAAEKLIGRIEDAFGD